MTDRYYAFTVTLDKSIRSDDAQPIIDAIRMIKGVSDVVPVVENVELHWAQERARRELGEKILAILYPDARTGDSSRATSGTERVTSFRFWAFCLLTM